MEALYTIVYFRDKQYQMISSKCFKKINEAKKYAKKLVKALPNGFEWDYKIEMLHMV